MLTVDSENLFLSSLQDAAEPNIPQSWKIKGLILLSVIVCVLCSCLGQNMDAREWVETIGYIKGSPSNCYIYYEVNGVTYKLFYPRRYGSAYEGEKGMLKYNKSNPKDAEAIFWRLVFTPDEQTITFKGKIIKIFRFGFSEPKYALTYSYEVEGEELIRTQVLPPHYRDVYPNLEKGQYYEVQSWVENVQRAIIHLDKPIN